MSDAKTSLLTNADRALITNLFTARQDWIRKFMSGESVRDIDKECGHPQLVDISDFQESFTRGDIAGRIISIYPEETWAHDPEVYEQEEEGETEFESRWKEMEEELGVYSILQTADVLSGIGRFGALLIGVNDGKELDQPIDGIMSGSPKTDLKVIYMRPFDESVVQIAEIETDKKNPRYGQPTRYNLTFVDATSGMSAVSQQSTLTITNVHWTRVIHIADNRKSSLIYGTPRLELVWNRLLDLKKIAGGSGEMLWKGGFPGFALETQPTKDGETMSIDVESVKDQMENYMEKLKRYVALEGLTIKNLSPQVADPTHHAELQIRLIAIAMSVPWRILMGVEVGQLASEQDMQAWNRRLRRRREKYINPYILRPLMRRLIAMGALPKPSQLKIYWPDLNTPSDTDKATVAEKMVNAVSKYMQSGCDAMVPPLHFFTLFLKWDVATAEAVIEAAMNRSDNLDLTPPMVEAALIAAKAKAEASNKPAPRPA